MNLGTTIGNERIFGINILNQQFKNNYRKWEKLLELT